MASLGEETRASCRGPSNHNSVALILPHKAMLGFDGGAIGADIYCDRTGIHARKVGDCAKILDALKDPERGYYDPRDPFTTVPRSSVLPSYAEPRQGHRRAGVAEGHAPRRHPRVDGLSEGLQDRAADRRRRDEGDQDGARRQARRDAGGVERSAVDARSRRRADEGRLPRGAGAAGAGVHAGPAVPPEGRRHAGVQGIRRRDRADRIRAGQNLRHGHDAADRLLRRAGGRPHRAAAQSRPRHHPESGTGDGVPLPHLAIPDAPRRRLEGQGLHRDADRLGAAQRALEILGRRPARRVQELGGGRRPAQPARRSARASTSASCCASCCAAPT